MRDLGLVVHMIGLTMALGTGFANLFLGAVASKLEPAERGSFMSKVMVLARMGQIGLGLLILSGLYLITPYWSTLSSMPTLVAKLLFVLLLVIMVAVLTVIANKAKRENNPALLAKLKPFGIINFLLGITILILAVLTFH